MKKKILIVLEEIIQGIPSGVITVTDNLISKIYKENDIQIITNKTHWILKNKNNFKYIKKIKKNKIKFSSYSELDFYLKKKLPKLFIKLILLPIKFLIFFRMINYVYNFLKKNKFDLIINQSGGWPGGELNFAVSIASHLIKIKNILIIHNLSSYKKNFFTQFIYIRDRVYNLTATHIITVSKICKLNLIKNTFLKKISVVKNGTNDFSKLKKITINKINRKKFIIGFVGHIHERKGIETILEAIKYSQKEIQLIIIGGGNKNYLLILKKLAMKNDVDILFESLQKKPLNFYHRFDLFILPSKKFESFGLVVIEAMSCGKAIICSDFGGMKEIIVNNKNGLLFKKNNSEDLRKKIKYLKENEKISKKISKNAKLSYHKLYTSDIMVKNYKKYF